MYSSAAISAVWQQMQQVIADRKWWWPRHVISPATAAAESQLDSAYGSRRLNDGNDSGVARGGSDATPSASAAGARGSVPEEAAAVQLPAPGWQQRVASQAIVAAFVDKPDNGLVAVYQRATAASSATAEDGAGDGLDEVSGEEGSAAEGAHVVRRAVAAVRSLRRREQCAADAAAAEEAAAVAEKADREAAAALECQRMQPGLEDRSSVAQAAEERRIATFAAAGTLGRAPMKPLQPEWWRLFPQTARQVETLDP